MSSWGHSFCSHLLTVIGAFLFHGSVYPTETLNTGKLSSLYLLKSILILSIHHIIFSRFTLDFEFEKISFLHEK